MKLLRTCALALVALGIATFVVWQLYSAVTVVPWQETWRSQQVHLWRVVTCALLGTSVLLFVGVAIGKRRRAG